MSTKAKMQVEQKVPENFQRKVTRDSKIRELKATLRAKRLDQNKKNRSLWEENAKKYDAEYKSADKALVDNLRKAKAEGGFYVPAESRLIFVTRIKGINALAPGVRQTLRLLKLRQLHNGAFVRVNKASIEMLRKVEPCITYGYPSRKVVRELVYKRGYAKVNGQRIPLSNNTVIEENLGKYGIHCIEDLIHELYTVGPHFKEANKFLWAFKLRCPKGGFKCKRHSFHNNGDWGNREDLINDIVSKMI